MALGVTDPEDARLTPFRSLRDGVLRDHGDAPSPTGEPVGPSLFVAESEEMVRRALLSGHRVVRVLADTDCSARLAPVLPDTVEVLVASAAVIATVSGLGVHRGALALVERPPVRTVADVVREARRVVVLESVTNPVNVGLIARSAAALGIDALVTDRHSADPLYRRAITASRGATLSLAWAREAPGEAVLETLRGAGFMTVALTLAAGSTPLASALADHRSRRIALVLGNEGRGLSSPTEVACDVRATIEIDNCATVDSLNVAAAAAIAFHELRRIAPR